MCEPACRMCEWCKPDEEERDACCPLCHTLVGGYSICSLHGRGCPGCPEFARGPVAGIGLTDEILKAILSASVDQ